MNYENFLNNKRHEGVGVGFDPVWMSPLMFPFQADVATWSIQTGRSAAFADCGMGKTLIQLVVAENVARKTGGRVLILTPLAVAFQTVKEGAKFGIEVTYRKEGLKLGDRIVVTNYERLHYFSPEDFEQVICDESSILKNFDGAIRASVTDFMRKRPYRMLCTATAAPNDYIELGTSSEALGGLGAVDMFARFFKKTERIFHRGEEYRSGNYRFRGHAEEPFWRWVCSWARALRKPSDMGYDDGNFKLPELVVDTHTVTPVRPRNGMLFDVPAVGLQEEREDLRNSLEDRCEKAAELANSHNGPVIAWCNLNPEGKLLSKLIDGAVEVSGSDDDERKEEVFSGFISGQIRALVTKPKIAGFGLNFQHCSHEVFFPSHSYEQYYQAVRRCWRFGQSKSVTVDVVITPGQAYVMDSLKRKSAQADQMFDRLVSMMWKGLSVMRNNDHTNKQELPQWL